MRVRDLMSTEVHTCTRDQTLHAAARVMWEHDVGCVPIVDDRVQPIAMLTDRDICMAAYTRGQRVEEIPISSAMSAGVHTCHQDDLLLRAEQTMSDAQVRRLPVVNDEGTLVGILSLNDIVLARTRGLLGKVKERLLGDVTRTLAAISRRRLIYTASPES